MKEVNRKDLQFSIKTFIHSFIFLLFLFYILYTEELIAYILDVLYMVRNAYNYTILILTFTFMYGSTLNYYKSMSSIGSS